PWITSDPTVNPLHGAALLGSTEPFVILPNTLNMSSPRESFFSCLSTPLWKLWETTLPRHFSELRACLPSPALSACPSASPLRATVPAIPYVLSLRPRTASRAGGSSPCLPGVYADRAAMCRSEIHMSRGACPPCKSKMAGPSQKWVFPRRSPFLRYPGPLSSPSSATRERLCAPPDCPVGQVRSFLSHGLLHVSSSTDPPAAKL